MNTRSINPGTIQVRSTETGNTLSGYAILWNSSSKEIREGGRKFTETIDRSAFDIGSQSNDVKLFFQHQSDMPLARSANGSLQLRNDPKGLHFSAELPNTSLGNDVKELLRTGILSGEMSFGFTVQEQRWSENNTKRAVSKGTLYELSVVVDPAYPNTNSSLREEQVSTQQRIDSIRRNRIV